MTITKFLLDVFGEKWSVRGRLASVQSFLVTKKRELELLIFFPDELSLNVRVPDFSPFLTILKIKL